MNDQKLLTRQHGKHVCDEEVVESYLGLWDRTTGPVELGHHNGQAKPLLVICLQ